MLLTHYAPDVTAYLVTSSDPPCDTDGSNISISTDFRDCVVVDFAGQLKHLHPSVLSYVDLSPSGDANHAAEHLFAALREGESVVGARALLLPHDLPVGVDVGSGGGVLGAVRDRMYRAASGRVAKCIEGRGLVACDAKRGDT